MSKWERKKKAEQVDEERFYDGEGGEVSSDDDNEVNEPVSIDVRICLWEFGQNDPKRFGHSQLSLYSII